MAEGKVGSTEKGSGARFNDGKAHVEYIPMRVIEGFYRWVYTAHQDDDKAYITTTGAPLVALKVCESVRAFEEGGDKDDLLQALNAIKGHAWRGSGAQFHFGASKYEAWNWARGMRWSVVIACLKRHLIEILDGNEIDEESGVHHFGAVGCNLIMLIHYFDFYLEGDDRPPQYIFDCSTGGAQNCSESPVDAEGSA